MRTAFTRIMSVVLCLLGAARAQAVEATTPPPIPASDFARFSIYEDLVLSPDGRHLAATARDEKGEYALLVLKPPQKKPVSGLKFSYEKSVGEVHWVSNERLIVSMAYQEGSADAPARTGELFGMNIDGSGKKYLFGYGGSRQAATRIKAANEAVNGFARFMRAVPADPTFALVAMTQAVQSTSDGNYFSNDYMPLYRMNVTTGKLYEVAKSPIRSPIFYSADDQGRPRLVYGMHDDSKDAQTYWRDETHDWQRVTIAGDALTPLAVESDGSKAYFLVEPSADRRCLIELQIPVRGAESQRALFCKAPRELQEVHFTAQGRPFGYSGVGISSFVALDDKALHGRVLTSLQAQFQGQQVSLVSASNQAERLILTVSSDRNSGEFYLYDAASQQALFLAARDPWLDPARMAEVKQVRFKARDGLDIDGYLTLPKGKPAKALPMVVVPHGGPFGVADGWRFDSDSQFLASRGYLVMQTNFRGSGGRGDAFVRKGYGEWGGKMIDDLTDGVRWAVAEGYADPKRLCIFGASYGGYAALMSAVREPELYRCAVGYVGVYDLNLLAKDTDIINLGSGRLYLQQAVAASPEERARQSPITYVDRLRAAVMIVHGERDIRVPFTQAKALRRALDAKKHPYEWLVKEDEGHGFFNENNRTELYEKLAAFLQRHIGD